MEGKDLSSTNIVAQNVWWRPKIELAIREDCLIKVYEGGQPQNQILCDRVSQLLRLLGENIDFVQKAYWIDNPLLVTLFEASLKSIEAKHRLNPARFRVSDWRTSVDSPTKDEFMKHLNLKMELTSNILETDQATFFL